MPRCVPTRNSLIPFCRVNFAIFWLMVVRLFSLFVSRRNFNTTTTTRTSPSSSSQPRVPIRIRIPVLSYPNYRALPFFISKYFKKNIMDNHNNNNDKVHRYWSLHSVTVLHVGIRNYKNDWSLRLIDRSPQQTGRLHECRVSCSRSWDESSRWTSEFSSYSKSYSPDYCDDTTRMVWLATLETYFCAWIDGIWTKDAAR